jgi:hypothetical protein
LVLQLTSLLFPRPLRLSSAAGAAFAVQDVFALDVLDRSAGDAVIATLSMNRKVKTDSFFCDGSTSCNKAFFGVLATPPHALWLQHSELDTDAPTKRKVPKRIFMLSRDPDTSAWSVPKGGNKYVASLIANDLITLREKVLPPAAAAEAEGASA